MAEKYTQWADRSCGVNPFVPGDIPLPKQTFQRLGRYVMGSLIAVPRMSMALGLISLCGILQVIFNEHLLLVVFSSLSGLCKAGHLDSSLLQPLCVVSAVCLLSVLLSFVKLSLITTIRRWGTKTALAAIPPILGVRFTATWANSARVVGVKASAEEKAKNKKESPLAAIEAGDVVISNLTNVLEILFYESSCPVSPLYVFPSYLPAHANTRAARTTISDCDFICRPASFSEAVSRSTTYCPLSERSSSAVDGKPLVVLLAEAKKQGRPVILFIEGVRSNGSGVLEFPPQVFRDVAADVRVHLCGFLYPLSSTVVAPPCPAGSALTRLFWLAAAISAPVSATANVLLARCGAPSLAQVGGKSTSAPSDAVSDKRVATWLEEVRGVFAKLVNKKSLKLSMLDYDSFFQYYAATSAGNTAEAKKISDARGGKK